jgi:hypothetical protein
MTRRKGEITARMNERDYAHIVELAVPSGGFRSKSDEMVAFHRKLGIEARRGRGRNDDANSTCASASPILRTPMLCVIGLVAPG